LGKSYQAIRQEHIKDYQALFGRVNINLGTSNEDNLPLDQRIKNYNKDKDPALTALYFQFGRYLLISLLEKARNQLIYKAFGVIYYNLHGVPTGQSTAMLKSIIGLSSLPIYLNAIYRF
jgi:hypothetical protein